MIFDCYVTVDSAWKLVPDAVITSPPHAPAIFILSHGVTRPAVKSSLPIVIIDPTATGVSCYGALTSCPEITVSTLNAALDWCAANAAECMRNYLAHPPAETNILLIGNAATIASAVLSPWLRNIYVNQLQLETTNAVNSEPLSLQCAHMHTQPQLCRDQLMHVYNYTNVEELAYLRLVERLLAAPERPDRTGVGTHGLFHEVLKFTLSTHDGRSIIPLMTTKRMWFAKIYHELIWFLQGSTDTTYMVENGVHIWDGNSTREYLDARGLPHYVPGEVGPVYGFQWRHAGAKYINMETRAATDSTSDHLGEGIDQIELVIATLRKDPWDRRMIVCSWNPAQLAEMALPPCHYSYQFHVDPSAERDPNGNIVPKYLNCLVNMRSSDIILGVPFNIVSYALLTHIVADACGLIAGTLSLSMSDCHLYKNHVNAARTLITRTPRQFPTITLPAGRKTRRIQRVDDYAYDYKITDYAVTGYAPHPAVNVPMAV